MNINIISWDSCWDNVFSTQEWGKYPSESLIQFIARNYYRKDRSKVRLLEVGCGAGANVWYMAREGFEVTGIDASATGIQIAKSRLDSEGLLARMIIGDVSRLPFESEYFDAVIDSECIYSNRFEDAEKILDEVKRVLRTGGLFYSRTFTDKNYIGQRYDIVGEMEYLNISDGPMAGKGFCRLVNHSSIQKLYGKRFRIISIDQLECTRDNGKIIISEYVIICQKTC